MILIKLIFLFLALMVFGILLTLILFKFNITKFRESELSTKIFFWFPITAIFIFFAFANSTVQLIGLSLLILLISYEYFKVRGILSKNRLLFISYFIFLISGFIHLAFLKFLQTDITNLLLVLGFGSALSDVTAFFFGNYFGKHKLPSFINPNKSWEGILGQIVGAFIGVLLIKLFIVSNVSILLFLPIGIGSAIGDITNSYMKRKVNLTSWSNFIPGHGGFIDRFSSLNGSSLLTFYYLFLSQNLY